LKAGVYGIIRTVASFFYRLGTEEAVTAELAGKLTAETASSANDIRSLGLVLIMVALITMLTGVVLAIAQSDIKRTLAYSSISQIGFILFGVGCFVYLGEEGAIGLAGSLYHVVNHALFKGCLFLAAGSIMFRNHELNMFHLGGLSAKMRLTTAFWFVATMGIAGIPLFNGFASKTLLHHAIIEAQLVAAESGLPEAALLSVAETLFVITCAGTVLYFSKLTYYVFIRKNEKSVLHHGGKITEVPFWMVMGTGILAAGVIAIGIMPDVFLRHVLLPAVGVFHGLEASNVSHLYEISFFTLNNIKNTLIPFALGTAGFAVALHFKLFEEDEETHQSMRWPEWACFNYLYITMASTFVSTCLYAQKNCNNIQSVIKVRVLKIFHSIILVDGDINRKYQLLRLMILTVIPTFLKAYQAAPSGHIDEAIGNVSAGILDDTRVLMDRERDLTGFITHDLVGAYDVLSGTYHHMQDILAQTPEVVASDLKNLEFVEHEIISSINFKEALITVEDRALVDREYFEKQIRRFLATLFPAKIKNQLTEDYRRLSAFSNIVGDDISLGALFSAIFMVGLLLYWVFLK
jgi:hypothetical protein